MGLDWYVELYDDHDKFMKNIANEDIEGADDHYAEGWGYTYFRGKIVSNIFNEFLGLPNICYGEEIKRDVGTEIIYAHYILPSEFQKFKNLLREVSEIVEKKDCKEEMKELGYDEINELIADIDHASNFFDHIIDYNKNGNGWGDEDEIRSTMYIWCSY